MPRPIPSVLLRSTMALLVLVSAACSGPVEQATTTTTAAPTTSGVFDFEATLIGGAAFDSASYTGRDVLVWFWAPW